ncbi:GNAT family N-acetyltransferase [Tenacibaculum soleae]|uniref:GNAT family N-acetyltransferase n=1 Tax=Tenacibaculum soleae TaxID=447689 RepID=UPI000A67324A|nr:GNAT family N-acetyltransferase [Tenacibaculum soleae]MDO6813472.1 GNAT family N-acetyltransferase [Tenacibaculum soleae]
MYNLKKIEIIKITKANTSQAKLFSKISVPSFLTAHGHSAPPKDMDAYIANNFKESDFIEELETPENEYYLLEYESQTAGYSKIIFNKTCKDVTAKNITYMSRLYLLEEFYGLGLGKKLFDFNVALCKENNQSGIWLNVWVENKKAIQFYKKVGFTIVGETDFQISASHSNPNHIMYLAF